MRYKINFDKTINQLIPHYMGGRKLILYLQALMKPLQMANDEFVSYAKETRIDALMTSQVIKFEWYLNRKLHKYFLPNEGKITIQATASVGLPLYHSKSEAIGKTDAVLYNESEKQKSAVLHHQGERTTSSSHSFIVVTPNINEALISKDEYIAMLSYYIDRYRISGKTYDIKFNNNERI